MTSAPALAARLARLWVRTDGASPAGPGNSDNLKENGLEPQGALKGRKSRVPSLRSPRWGRGGKRDRSLREGVATPVGHCLTCCSTSGLHRVEHLVDELLGRVLHPSRWLLLECRAPRRGEAFCVEVVAAWHRGLGIPGVAWNPCGTRGCRPLSMN